MPRLSHPRFAEKEMPFSCVDDGETTITALATNARIQNPVRIKNMSLLIIFKRGQYHLGHDDSLTTKIAEISLSDERSNSPRGVTGHKIEAGEE